MTFKKKFYCVLILGICVIIIFLILLIAGVFATNPFQKLLNCAGINEKIYAEHTKNYNKNLPKFCCHGLTKIGPALDCYDINGKKINSPSPRVLPYKCESTGEYTCIKPFVDVGLQINQ